MTLGPELIIVDYRRMHDLLRWPTFDNIRPLVLMSVQRVPRITMFPRKPRVNEAVRGPTRLYEDLHYAGSTFSSNIYVGSTFSSSIYAGSTFKTLVQPRKPLLSLLSSEPYEHLVYHQYLVRGIVGLGHSINKSLGSMLNEPK